MQINDELRVIVEAEVEKAIANMRKLDESVDNTEKHTKSLSEAIDSISGKSMILSAAVGGAGIAAIKFAGDIENTQASLEVLLKDGDAASKMFREWQTLAAETPFSSTDIDSAGKKLLAFNIEAGKVTDTLRTIGDISAATGSSISDIADIYGKARVQGRLFAEDINQFQGRGIPVVQALAEVLGTSETNIKKMVEQGKIGFPELEKAFQNMTGPGGQFEGMMEKLSTKTLGKFATAMDNGRMAMASFGEIMLPTSNDVLDAATEIFQGFTDLDDGTKRFIITMGGVVMVSGPAILAIKGINTALAAMAANPAIIGITATVAGIALLAASIDKYNHQLEDSVSKIEKTHDKAVDLVDAWSGLNDQKVLDRDTTDELIKLYPKLQEKLHGYKTTAEEAKEAIKELTAEQTKNAVQGQVNYLNKLLSQMENDTKQYTDAKNAYQQAFYDLQSAQLRGEIDDDTFSYRLSQVATQTNVYNLEKNIKNAQSTFKKSLEEINREITNTGYMLDKNLKLIEIPVAIKVDEPGAGGTGGSDDNLKKRWQQWFEEIAKVSEKAFGSSGLKAGMLYIDGIESAAGNAQDIAKALGENFDISGALKSQQDEIRKTLTSLLSIDPSEIDSTFTIADSSIQVMIDKFRELSKEITDLDYKATFDGMSLKIEQVGKSEDELALAAYKAKGYTDSQAESLVDLNNELSKSEILAEYSKRVDELGESERQLAIDKFALLGATQEEIDQFTEMYDLLNQGGERSFQDYFTDGVKEMLDQWGVLDEQVNASLANISYQLANMSFDAALSGISDVGKAFAEGADAGEAMQQALANMALQILDQLPLMFLQAGLQLIANDNWPMGLAFIAAAGSTAFISGFTKGTIDKESGDTTTNAKGGAYDTAGLIAFAKGGAFTNSIVNSPTVFKFASGTGLMGEAGPEAIVPLKRGADGSLGISAYGDSGNAAAAVTVNIINNTSESVERKESTNTDGSKQIDIMIGQLIVNKLSDGTADRALRGRYGVKPVGVS